MLVSEPRNHRAAPGATSTCDGALYVSDAQFGPGLVLFSGVAQSSPTYPIIVFGVVVSVGGDHSTYPGVGDVGAGGGVS